MTWQTLSRPVALLLPLLLGLSACPAGEGGGSSGETGETGETDGTPTTGGEPSELEPPGERFGSDKPRAASGASAEDLAAMASDERAFGAALFAALPASADNRAVSPTSIRFAFGQTYAGARTISETEIETAVKFTLPPEQLHAAFNSVDLELESRNLPISGELDGDDSVQLALVNQVFGALEPTWEPAFLDILAESYGTAMHGLDFKNDPEAGRVAINGWVDAVTKAKIPELLPAASISSTVQIVLVNALYLKAPWATGFEFVDEAGKFTRIDDSEATVAMMRGQQDSARFLAGEGFQAAELPLRGDELSMVIILPDAGTFEQFAGALDGAGLGQIFADLQPTALEVSLPRFKFSSSMALKAPLMALGMTSSFELGGGDFSGMSPGGGGWFISDVFHDVFVGVDEKGIEAAAATAVVINDSGDPGPGEYFTADRPFLFAIRDRGTDSLLFLGRVLDPSK